MMLGNDALLWDPGDKGEWPVLGGLFFSFRPGNQLGLFA